jgi:hypothetical protein
MDSDFLSGLKSIDPTDLNKTSSNTLAAACTANNKKFIPKLLDDSTALFSSVIVIEERQYEANAAISSYLNLFFIKVRYQIHREIHSLRYTVRY